MSLSHHNASSPAAALSRAARFSRGLWQAPARLAMLAVALYQRTFSPVLPALLGPGCGCRFHPTCSHYAVDALREHGLCAGVCLSLWRILRCHPWSPGGYDPVTPRCQRVATGRGLNSIT